MVYPAQSPETVPAPKPSCWFIFAGMWLFVYNYVSADSWVGFAEKIFKKDYFLTRRWSIEIVPDLSLPPCTVKNAQIDQFSMKKSKNHTYLNKSIRLLEYSIPNIPRSLWQLI